MRYLSLILSLSFFNIAIIADTHGQDCMEEMKKAYHNELYFIKHVNETGDGWKIKYIMTTQALNPNTKLYETITSEGELASEKNIRYMKAGNVEVIMDQKDTYTITHTNKTVMHTLSTPQLAKMTSDMYTKIMQDSILKTYRLTSCSKIKIKECDSPVTEYMLVANNNQTCQYLKLSVCIECSSNIFRKLHAEVNPSFSRAIRSFTLVVQQRDQYKNDNPSQHAKDIVFSKTGTMKEPYTGYAYKELVGKKTKKS